MKEEIAMNININSIKSIFIECIYINPEDDSENVLSTATGFLLEKNEKVFLITNKHVVTGKNIFTGELLDKNGMVPNFLRAYIYNEIERKGITQYLFANETIISLYENDEPIKSEKLWFEHLGFNSKIDVAAIDITDYCKNSCNVIFDVNDKDCIVKNSSFQFEKHINYNFNFKVTDDVYIVGFPFSYMSTSRDGYLPIWTKGTIASEYNKKLIVPLDAIYKENEYIEVPGFLVDAKTREGQSGSPVISMIKDNTILLGIYSGRTNKNIDLGYVWKAELIDEIICQNQ